MPELGNLFQGKGSRHNILATVLTLLVGVVLVLLFLVNQAPVSQDWRFQYWSQPTCRLDAGHEGRVLVVYAYFEKNNEYIDNMALFLAAGVEERDDVDFLFVVQGEATIEFPRLKNVRVLRRINDCRDLGAWRYGLDSVEWRDGRYRYFVFLNASVRGPFVPNYIPSCLHWTRLFTQLLREDGYEGSGNGPIKLAGLSINCLMKHPHVQSMLWAIDLEALISVIDNTSILTCKTTTELAISTGEIALSDHILDHGWNIASLLIAYRGWDFRRLKECNGEADPTLNYFGIEMGVHETIFIKMTRRGYKDDIKAYSEMIWQQQNNKQFVDM